jgi:hypothetical protein
MDLVERYTLTPDDDERAWTLKALSTGALAATYDLPLREAPAVRPAAGAAYRVEPYGPGWRLAARAQAGDEVLAWYTGRLVLPGGELLVAPDRAYAVRSRLLRRLDLHVEDAEDGARLLEATAEPHDDGGDADYELALLRRPTHEDDTELLVTFLAVLEVLLVRNASIPMPGSGSGG